MTIARVLREYTAIVAGLENKIDVKVKELDSLEPDGKPNVFYTRLIVNQQSTSRWNRRNNIDKSGMGGGDRILRHLFETVF